QNKNQCLPTSMPQESTRGSSRAFTVSKGHLTIDNNGMIPFRPLDTTPLTSWKVMGNLTDPIWLDSEFIHIVDHYVSRSSFTHSPTAREARRVRRQGR